MRFLKRVDSTAPRGARGLALAGLMSLLFFAACSSGEGGADSVDANDGRVADTRDPEIVEALAAEGEAIIELETEHFQMGEIPNHEPAEKFMKVYNRGDGPLVITKIATTCSCTRGFIVDKVIPPQGEGQIRIVVEPTTDRIPHFETTKTLTIFSNDPGVPAIRLPVTTQVQPGAEWEPRRLDFGAIAEGETAEKTVRLRQLQVPRIEIRGETKTVLPFVEAEHTEVDPSEWTDPQKPEYDITVRINPGADEGIYKSNVLLVTNLPRLVFVLIPYSVTVGNPVESAMLSRSIVPLPEEAGIRILDSQYSGLNSWSIRVEHDGSESWVEEGSFIGNYTVFEVEGDGRCVVLLDAANDQRYRICIEESATESL